MSMTLFEQIITLGMVVLGTMATIVVYCIRDVSLVSGNHGIPEFISIGVVAFLHIWKRKMLLSLASGTLLYMLLIRM